jgi:hypothetical protein
MISMYSAREQAADRFNHSPEAEAYRRSSRLDALRATLIAQGCTATSPARLDAEGERMAREDRQS